MSTTGIYQNYTSWGDIDSGHFEFNGSVTGIPYADFLAGDVYGWYRLRGQPDQRSHVEFGFVRQRRHQGIVSTSR